MGTDTNPPEPSSLTADGNVPFKRPAGFVMLLPFESQWFAQQGRHGPKLQAVYLAIKWHARSDKPEAWPGYGRLAMLTGLSERSVADAIGMLSSCPFLTIRPGGGRKANRYVFEPRCWQTHSAVMQNRQNSNANHADSAPLRSSLDAESACEVHRNEEEQELEQAQEDRDSNRLQASLADNGSHAAGGTSPPCSTTRTADPANAKISQTADMLLRLWEYHIVPAGGRKMTRQESESIAGNAAKVWYPRATVGELNDSLIAAVEQFSVELAAKNGELDDSPELMRYFGQTLKRLAEEQ